jgi:hypothetical protein
LKFFMMNRIFTLSIFLTVLLFTESKAQVTGKVFRDFNFNGTQQATNPIEPNVVGVKVKATLPDGTAFNALTDAMGNYSFTAAQIPAGTKARIEFTDTLVGDFNSVNGTGNGTNVQFVTGGDIANYAVSYAPNYSSTTNPTVVTPTHVRGATTSTINPKGVLAYPYLNSGVTTAPTNLMTKAQVGSTWGIGYDKYRQTVYAGAFLKRHVALREGLATNPLGAIYKIKTDGSGFGLWTEVTNPGTVADNATRNVNGAANTVSKDPLTYGLIGKVGLGDVEVDEFGENLYTMNLNTRQLVKIPINADGTAGTQVTYPIPTSGVAGVVAADA